MLSQTYIELGYRHILDPQGYDHILFVVALCASFLFKDWKKVLVLVTAFTVGHSVTLALASLGWVKISSSLVESLIPITIIATSLYHIVLAYLEKKEHLSVSYAMALGFGLIHGLGFSNYLRAMLDKDEHILWPLLSFNIGLELGQIVIVFFTLSLSLLLVEVLKIKQKYYTMALSSIILFTAAYLMF